MLTELDASSLPFFYRLPYLDTLDKNMLSALCVHTQQWNTPTSFLKFLAKYFLQSWSLLEIFYFKQSIYLAQITILDPPNFELKTNQKRNNKDKNKSEWK